MKLTFEVSMAVNANINKLVKDSSARDREEVLIRALATYDLLTEIKAKGGKVMAVYEDGQQVQIDYL